MLSHYLLLLILLIVDIIAAAEIHTTSATALLSIDQSNHQSIEIESVKVTMTTAIESNRFKIRSLKRAPWWKFSKRGNLGLGLARKSKTVCKRKKYKINMGLIPSKVGFSNFNFMAKNFICESKIYFRGICPLCRVPQKKLKIKCIFLTFRHGFTPFFPDWWDE